MFELALEFANMKQEQCTAENLLRIFATHRVHFTYGEIDHFDDWFFSMGQHIALRRGTWIESEIRKNSEEQDWKLSTAIPSDVWYSERLWEVVAYTREMVCEVFDAIIEDEGVTSKLASQLCKDLEIKISVIGDSDDPWQPNMGIFPVMSCLEYYVISQEIVLPLYYGKGQEFQRLKQCPECGNYFYAKDIRKVFCSVKCKSSNAYRLKNMNK